MHLVFSTDFFYMERCTILRIPRLSLLDGPWFETRWGGGAQIFLTHPDQPWGLLSLLYSGFWVSPGVKAVGAWR